MRAFANDYPKLFVGIFFGTLAFVCAGLVSLFYLLILRRDGLIDPGSGIPFDAYIFLYIQFLPGLLTGMVAAVLGGSVLDDPEIGGLQAGLTGAGIAAVSFILWGLAGELLWALVDFPAPNPAHFGVVDFLALLGYGLMVLVFVVVVMLGAVVSLWLRSWRTG